MQQGSENQEVRPPVPPFDEESARQKVKAAQDAWNTRDPEKVSLAYTPDSKWRNRDEFFEGREAIRDFLTRKWARELDYRLEKNLWCFTGSRIAVRFEYESRDAEGQWWRSHGNELWEFDENGLMKRRDASINDYEIEEPERKFRWARLSPPRWVEEVWASRAEPPCRNGVSTRRPPVRCRNPQRWMTVTISTTPGSTSSIYVPNATHP
jgi:uncharacterized protein